MNVLSDQLEHQMWSHIISKSHQQTSEEIKMPWESSATSPYLILCAKTLSVWCQHNKCLQSSQAALICFSLPLCLVGVFIMHLMTAVLWWPWLLKLMSIYGAIISIQVHVVIMLFLTSWSHIAEGFHLTHLGAQYAVQERIMKLHLSSFIGLIICISSLVY